MQIIFMILLYLHFCSCGWYFIVTLDNEWQPGQEIKDDFYELTDIGYIYIITYYVQILGLTGNDIQPANLLQYAFANLTILIGAIMSAAIFGEFTSIVQTMNRKQMRFQHKIEHAKSAMFNLKLNDAINLKVIDFMSKTQSHLDNQRDLEEFLKILSPSLKQMIMHHVFETAMLKNDVFNE